MGLERVRQIAPSTIAIDTIYRSKGKIPGAFLRGCGVSEGFIVFAEVAHHESHWVLLLFHPLLHQRSELRQLPLRRPAEQRHALLVCTTRRPRRQETPRADRRSHIRLHDKLRLILSPHCMESEWVKTEIAKARKLRGARPTARPVSYSARGPSQPCATGSASTPTTERLRPRDSRVSQPRF